MREVLLLGLRRAGKTSISRVVFGNMDPRQTQYLHATYAVTPTQVSADALAKFTILDFPGQEDLVAKDIVGMQGQMRECGALVFVLDCTDYIPASYGGKRADYEEAINRLVLVVQQMHVVAEPGTPKIVDVFLHKADKLTSEHQRSVQEEVRQQVGQRLKAYLTPDIQHKKVDIQYHLTSIFDHSVFYAFSLVARRVIPNIVHIQSLLQVCCNNSHVLSYFLFGISRRMFIASANVNGDRQALEREVLEYECCSDVVDLFSSMHSFALKHKPAAAPTMTTAKMIHNSNNNNHINIPTVSPVTSPQGISTFPPEPAGNSSTNATTTHENNGNTTTNNLENNNNEGLENVCHDATSKMMNGNNNHNNNSSAAVVNAGELVDTTQSAIFNFPMSRPFDNIKPVYMVRQVGPLLTLVVGLKNENIDSTKSSVEYNVNLLENALMKILHVNEEILRSSS
jgi:Ras-related GTP-binding protein C/D